MLLRWFPWRWLVRRLARAHGLLDPLEVLGRMENLAQPSEVAVPIELLRAGVALHARGVINGRVIQQNLDWVWPYWVNRQFDPTDPAYLPRGFSLAHVNLSHRNWTGVGVPGCEAMPIVDPRGLVTPLFDGWSLDAWVVPQTGEGLYPSHQDRCDQSLLMEANRLAVRTRTEAAGKALVCEAWVEADGEQARCRVDYDARLDGAGWLVLSLRPLNPEGVGLVERIELSADRRGWEVDGRPCVRFDVPADRSASSAYEAGDVAIGLLQRPASESCRCKVGMATAAALFEAPDEGAVRVQTTVDLSVDRSVKVLFPRGGPRDWDDALEGCATLEVPDDRFRFLYDAALRSLVLLSPEDVYPGPYTYKRFWYRDAVIVLSAMLGANLGPHIAGSMERLFTRQRLSGYFHSQSGEWDSNGQVLWLIGRWCALTGGQLPSGWHDPVRRGARWIARKRTAASDDGPHAGLLPAGFSAEHLGTNDYYYWDDFWSVAGLRAAATLLDGVGEDGEAQRCREQAADLLAAIEQSLERSRPMRTRRGIPASPYRRMDAGSVASLVCSYPLALWRPDDPRILETLEFLTTHCTIEDLFFMGIAHAGFNAYLTLSIAQAMLRAGDSRYFRLVRGVARAASATGQWPEAIHPHTGGGCMGDGQHAWASAEWLLMMRSLFVREEAGTLILCSGLPDDWLSAGTAMSFGPTPTPYGPLKVRVEVQSSAAVVRWDAQWRAAPPTIEVRLAGQTAVTDDPAADEVRIEIDRTGDGQRG